MTWLAKALQIARIKEGDAVALMGFDVVDHAGGSDVALAVTHAAQGLCR